MANFLIALIVSIFAIQHIESALFLWSKRKFEISPLRSFNDDSYQQLLEDLGNPVTITYRAESLIPELRELLIGYHTVYLPNGDLSSANATDISVGDGSDLEGIKKANSISGPGNVLSVVTLPNKRIKRDLESTTATSTTSEVPAYKPPTGPVLYKGKSIKDDTFGLLYSSQPLLLKTNNTNLYLGNTLSHLVTVDTRARDSYSRLNVNIPNIDESGNKVILRFIFAWLSSYWSLVALKITDTKNNWSFNLTVDGDATAAARFSYHCSGETVFSDPVNMVELYIYDMQVQIDSQNGKFSDAYDCVHFTTPTIWSGLFITGILGIGLVVALVAIGNIKTMDKFDNHKTKQLAITVTE